MRWWTKPTLWRELRFWGRVALLPSFEARKIAVQMYLNDRRRLRVPIDSITVFRIRRASMLRVPVAPKAGSQNKEQKA